MPTTTSSAAPEKSFQIDLVYGLITEVNLVWIVLAIYQASRNVEEEQAASNRYGLIYRFFT